MNGMAGMTTCKTLTLDKGVFSCCLEILSLSLSSRSAVFNYYYKDTRSSVYVAGVDHDIDGVRVPCFQKFF
jgi:hypothetical protein